jgi:hypothetical protein
VHARPRASRVSPVTGDDAARQREIESLVAERLESYAVPAMPLRVPNPARPISSDGSVPARTGVAVGWLGYGAALLQLAHLSDAAGRADHWLGGLATLAFVAGLLAIPVVLWRARRAVGQVPMRPELARPWLDLLDGIRLGATEPANPAWRVALERVARTRHLLRREARRWDQRVVPADEVLAEVQAAGARTWATSEAWRRHQRDASVPQRVSPLDRLPPVLGTSAEEASAASDASADAGTAALGEGDFDLDFAGFARRRAAMYARADGPDVRLPDPSEPLLVGASGLQRRRRRVVSGLVAAVASLGASWAFALSGELGWSVLVVVPAAVVWVRSRRLSWVEVWPRRTSLPPDLAMAWRDYLDAVAYADSGAAPVPTVEAIRGSEPRVRALLVELASASSSAVERPVLAAELRRLCSEAWTLMGQERAETRLLERLEDLPGTDRG